MKKNISIIIATLLAISTIQQVSFGLTKQVKTYEVFATAPMENYEPKFEAPPKEIPTFNDYENNFSGSSAKTRNEVLRESSHKFFADDNEPAWLKNPYDTYYPNPTFESLVKKYQASNYTGCMQEAEAYVRRNPLDTLGFYYLALSYTQVGDKSNAIKAYEKVIALNDSPMIVKYATNGRNCILGGSEQCYQNVDKPEPIYPYADYVNSNANALIPIDPETLVQRNLKNIKNKLNPSTSTIDNENPENRENTETSSKPFGKQDEKLDEFINAPYGSGLAPELQNEYKHIQLKKIQNTINNGSTEEEDKRNIQNIKKFDSNKTDSETIKLAYEPKLSEDWENLQKDPEFIQSQQELKQIQMMLGSQNDNNSNKKSSDLTDLIPYMTEENTGKMSPETLQMLMMQSLMGDMSF